MHFYQKSTHSLNQLQTLFPPLVRLWLGYVFLFEGIVKIKDMDLTIKFFSSLGIYWPTANAYIVTYLEITLGVLLIIGLLTRISAAILGIIIFVAIKVAFWPDLISKLDIFKLFEFSMFIGLLYLFVFGPGRYSVDNKLRLDNQL